MRSVLLIALLGAVAGLVPLLSTRAKPAMAGRRSSRAEFLSTIGAGLVAVAAAAPAEAKIGGKGKGGKGAAPAPAPAPAPAAPSEDEKKAPAEAEKKRKDKEAREASVKETLLPPLLLLPWAPPLLMLLPAPRLLPLVLRLPTSGPLLLLLNHSPRLSPLLRYLSSDKARRETIGFDKIQPGKSRAVSYKDIKVTAGPAPKPSDYWSPKTQ